MKTFFVGVALLLGCASPQLPPTAEDSTASTSRSSKLNDVQLDCRASNNLEIGRANLAFGPSCAGNTTIAAALKIFDYGSFGGFLDASDVARVQGWLCYCEPGPSVCPEETFMRVINDSKKVMVDEAGKRRRDGVLDITNDLESHQCLDATVGVELYKLGFSCGYVSGMRSRLIRDRLHEFFSSLEHGDSGQAAQHADECFEKMNRPANSP